MKTTILVAVVLVASTASTFAEERVIIRRVPACVQLDDLFTFYRFSRENPSMADLAQFLRNHPCMALSSGTRAKVLREDESKLFSCVHVAERQPCYWISRRALTR